MNTTVQKWGNSLAIRIPSGFAKEMGLAKDIDVTMKIDSKKLIISPRKNDLKLSNLLRKVEKSNIHEEVKSGKKHGKEIW